MKKISKKIKMLCVIPILGTLSSIALFVPTSCGHKNNILAWDSWKDCVDIKNGNEITSFKAGGAQQVLEKSKSGGFNTIEFASTIHSIGYRAFVVLNDSVWTPAICFSGKSPIHTALFDGSISFGDRCFSFCDSITHVVFHNDTHDELNIKFGNKSFRQCFGLQKVTFQSDVNDLNFDVEAFADDNKFLGFDGGHTITVSNIGQAVFAHDSALTFAGLNSLTPMVNSDEDLQIRKVITPSPKKGIFFSKGDLASNVLGCTAVGEIELDTFVEEVESGRGTITSLKFNDCASLTKGFITDSARISDLIVEADCFNGCTNLTSIDGATIGYAYMNAFSNCSELQSIHITSDCVHIDKESFANCKKLSKIYWDCSTAMGSLQIGDEPFNNCYPSGILYDNNTSTSNDLLTKLNLPSQWVTETHPTTF